MTNYIRQREKTPKQRFFDYVAIIPFHNCWEWVGGGGRYGQFWDGERQTQSHTFSFRIHNGEIPKGKIVMHTCDNTKCVNPSHLVLGSPRENTQDSIKKGRHRHGANRPMKYYTKKEV